MHPIDAAVAKLRAAAPASAAEQRPAGPPRALVLGHFAVAAAAFWVFSLAFFAGSPRLLGFGFQARWALGLVHTLTLGWAAMTLLGALLQMSSSHGGTALYRPRLAVAGFALLLGGLVSFVGLLWAGSERYWLGAAAAGAGVALYLVVLAGTMRRARNRDVTYWHFANALLYLALLGTLGVLLALDRQRAALLRDPDGALIAHVHLALVGWLSLSIAGASYRLVPAVAAYRARAPQASRLLAALLNAGLLGLTADSLFFGRRLLPLWAGLLAGAYLVYVWQALAGPQPPRGPSSAMNYIALGGGALWAGLGVALASGRLPSETGTRAAYVYAALLGWVTPHILAQAHKIFPFLVWLALSKLLPLERLPPWDRLVPTKLAWLEAGLLAAAIPAGAAGFLLERPELLRLSGGLLFGCASAYLAGTLRTFSHLAPCHLKALAAAGDCPLARG